MRKAFYLLAIIITGILIINSCTHEPPAGITSAPPPVPGGTDEVCFESEILPLFQSNCAISGCHDAISHKDDYIFNNYANITQKDIRPGDAINSKVYKVLFETGNKKMPPLPNVDLTAQQKALIGRWINEGAKNTINCNTNCDSSQFKYAANISMIMGSYCVGCHSGGAPSAGINLSNYTGVNQVAVSGRLVGSVSHAPGYSAMPKNVNKLSDCQIAQIRKWVNAGALNN